MSDSHKWSIDITKSDWFSWSPASLTWSGYTLLFPRSPTTSCSMAPSHPLVTNLHNTPIDITVTFEGSDPLSFKVSKDAGATFQSTVSFTIPVSGSQSLEIRFCPTDRAGYHHGLNGANMKMTCTTTGCSQLPGAIPCQAYASRCIGVLGSYTAATTAAEGTETQVLTSVSLKNQYAAGAPDYGGAGLLYWKLFYSTDGVTYVPWDDATGCTDGCKPHCVYPQGECSTGQVQPGASVTPDHPMKGTCPVYNINAGHKWYLGIKVWGQSETEPSTLQVISGPEDSIIPGLLILAGLIGGAFLLNKYVLSKH